MEDQKEPPRHKPATAIVTPSGVKSNDPNGEYGNRTDDDSTSHFSNTSNNPFRNDRPPEVVNINIKEEDVEEEDPAFIDLANQKMEEELYKRDTDDEGDSDEQEVISENPPSDGQEVQIKEEFTYEELHRECHENHRLYGDRKLLARQAKNGMMKLGGGNVKSAMWPANFEEQMARMNGRYAYSYSDVYNYGCPTFAGQPTACVTWYPYETRPGVHYDAKVTPFSVFVKRTVGNSSIGWEYVGEYLLMDTPESYDSAESVPQETKDARLKDMVKSLNSVKGDRFWITYWRKRICEACLFDPSPPGPRSLVRFAFEKKIFKGKKPPPEPTRDGNSQCQEGEDTKKKKGASFAAKARALGLDDKKLTDIQVAERLVHLDEYYKLYFIKFVEYDEEMYDFVKDGETTKNSKNEPRKEGEPCAKALDWYRHDDKTLGKPDQLIKKERKRKWDAIIKQEVKAEGE